MSKFRGVLSYTLGKNLPARVGPIDTEGLDRFATGVALVGAGVAGIIVAPAMVAGTATVSALTGLAGLWSTAMGSAGISKNLFEIMRADKVIDPTAIDVAEALATVGPAQIPMALGRVVQAVAGKLQTEATAALAGGIDKGQNVGKQAVKRGANRLREGLGLAQEGLVGLTGDVALAAKDARSSHVQNQERIIAKIKKSRGRHAAREKARTKKGGLGRY